MDVQFPKDTDEGVAEEINNKMILEYQSENKKYLLALCAVLLIAGISYIVWAKFSNDPEPVYCTEESKLCPDGSYVGRTGANCEFAECPGV